MVSARNCPISLTNTKVGIQAIRKSRLFREYLEGIEPSLDIVNFHVLWVVPRYASGSHRIADITTMFAEVTGNDSEGREFRTSVLLRGQTVEVLPIVITPDGERFILLIEQLREAVRTNVISTPTATVDNSTFRLTFLNELAQGVGIELNWSELDCLNDALVGDSQAFYVTPDGSDERVMYYAVETHVSSAGLHVLRDYRTGADDKNAHIVVRLLPYEDFPVHYGQVADILDGKTLTAWLMHHYATRRSSTS